ncbi:DUF2231 domain-containing protein [Paracoccus gahaiensis]|uniref:DUF2231 domain-containing protein n=1 Tax=Paracoccus gahaiensis TaxID=1706839 RepID=A0A4U0RFA1_9RHOB|nr:DUF2231 domain-containing protein [Paracoccus gahaiensis]TJZ94129.1 DUF2231 domain-containing protein [Paracoccus gahaiensis]
MRQKYSWKQRRRLTDPIEEHVAFSDTESKIAFAGHPLHAMMVAFPIALAFSVFGADGMYWLTGDEFWPRVALWAAGVAFGIGVIAGVTGTIELLMVPGIRIRSASWTHFILAVMLLSVLGLNWGYRLDDPVGSVLPWGFMISALGAGMTGITGWHGGKLVFDYQIGTKQETRSK